MQFRLLFFCLLPGVLLSEDSKVLKPETGHPVVQEESAFLEHAPDGHLLVDLDDMLFAAQDPVLRKDCEGKTVEFVGQWMADDKTAAGGQQFRAVKMFKSGDTEKVYGPPVGLPVETDQPPQLPSMTWVRIIGTATFPVVNGRRQAVVRAKTIEKAEAPTGDFQRYFMMGC